MQRKKPTKRYWAAYAALYGERQEEQLEFDVAGQHKKAPPKKNDSPKEDYEQIVSAVWLEKNNILFFHVPNGGSRNPIEGAKFKRMGVKAGIPDVVIPIARKGYHGLYIELKRVSGGVLSEYQRWWLDELKRQGYDTYVAKGAQDLINYVKNYMEMN
jgi:hypothetical protein